MMELKNGEERCVGQNLDEEDEATFTLKMASTEGHVVKAHVKDPDGKIVEEKVLAGGNSIDFYMRIMKRGVYDMCFMAQKVTLRKISPTHDETELPTVTFSVAYKNRQAGPHLKFKKDGGAADPSKKILKEDFPVLEEMLNDAEATLAHLSKEIDFARRQESELLRAGEAAARRIQGMGWFSIGVLATTALWQITYLRHFFTSKKLL